MSPTHITGCFPSLVTQHVDLNYLKTATDFHEHKYVCEHRLCPY